MGVMRPMLAFLLTRGNAWAMPVHDPSCAILLATFPRET